MPKAQRRPYFVPFLEDTSRFIDLLDLVSIVDILLVTLVFFALMLLLRGTQVINLVRGSLLFVGVVLIASNLFQLRAFSYMLRQALPILLVAIPVIFQPEIRRLLDQLGRAGSLSNFRNRTTSHEPIVDAIAKACLVLSEKRYGGLIVIERLIGLQEYVETGIKLDAEISPQLLIQIFYKDAPLHDGAAILRGNRIAAASCVLPLSNDPTMTGRQLGLRHRASKGITETSDAVAIVVSEETGIITVVQDGLMIRRLDETRLRYVLNAFYQPRTTTWWQRIKKAFTPRQRKAGD